MLRMWRAANGGWRASLESPQTGERRSFASLDDLMAFLAREETEPDGNRSSPPAASAGEANLP